MTGISATRRPRVPDMCLLACGRLPGPLPILHIAAMGTPKLDYSRLTAPERLRLVEELWDSLTPDQVPLTAAQAEELDRREAIHHADPGRGRPWREALDEIERQRGR
jgi:putative addiction module component (TIGR02574 family)